MGLTALGSELSEVTVHGDRVTEITADGVRVWPTTIMDFEDGSTVGDFLRGTDTGNASISSQAALATSQGSTQGLRYNGFNERYALPGDTTTPLESGREVSFLFRPRNFGSEQFHFMLAPQASASSPPDRCYRFEFHMAGGSRLAIIDGGRNVVDTENNTNWSNQTYECTFSADNGGVTFSIAGETLSTSDTRFVDAEMGFGWRASTDGECDWDWLSY